MNGIHCAFIATCNRQPDLRETRSGRLWLRVFATVHDNHSEDSQWVSIAFFDDHAIQLHSQLQRGDVVYVEGRIKLNTWLDPNGTEKTGLNVKAWKIVPMGKIGMTTQEEGKELPNGHDLDDRANIHTMSTSFYEPPQHFFDMDE